MSIHQLNIYGQDKVEVALERFKNFEPPEGYYLAFSGGKDSSVILELAKMSRVRFDAHYTLTSVDPPELVQFIKREHPEVIIDVPKYPDNYKNPKLAGKQITMWNLIPEKKMPPTRIVRYCCAELKESRGEGRFVVTGVRWQESSKRANRGGLELARKKSHRMENFDPDNPSQELIHMCPDHSRRHLNPIIDWTTEEIWEFIHEYNVPYCKLYDEGYKRLGCIGCPMGTAEHRLTEFERWPKYKQAYINAFDRMIHERSRGGIQTQSKSEESCTENGQTAHSEGSTTKRKAKTKHPEIIEQISKMDTRERFEYWLNGKSVPTKIDRHVLDADRIGTEVATNQPTNQPTKRSSENDSRGTVRVLDESKDLKKWRNGFSGEEVMEWWIR